MQNLALNSDLFLVICLELHCTSYFMNFFFNFRVKEKLEQKKAEKERLEKEVL